MVLTEYQYLQAVNIATSVYASAEYKNDIYLVRNGSRLLSVDAVSELKIDNIEVKFFNKVDPKTIFDYIVSELPDHYFFFQAVSPLNVHLAYKLSKKNVEISLGPDGYGAYGVFNKSHRILSLIKNSLKDNLYLIKNKLASSKFHFFDYYVYANHNFIDNVWLTHPEQYQHRAKNKVSIMKLPTFNDKCIKFIAKSFNFNDELPTRDVIYFFNQPLWGLLVDKEYEFLESVISKFPNDEVIVKLHPLTSLLTKNRFKNLPRVRIVESSVPAEVILLSLKNCIVLSGWSSVLITENSNCNYYFNYPIYKKLGDKILDQIIIKNLNHIKMISSPEEMMFPYEKGK